MNFIRTASILLVSAIAFAGCNKGPAVGPGGGGGGGNPGGTGGPNGGPVVSGSVMVMGTLDGQDFTYVVDGTDIIALGLQSPFNPYTYWGGLLNTVNGDTYNFFFGNIDSPDAPPTPSQFTSFFAPGTRPWADVQVALEQGVELEYVDADLNHWRTSFGSGDQTGSTFTITGVQSISSPNGPKMRIVGLFTAKVYSNDGSEMKQITNGKFRLEVPNF